jgi:uncharacterized protein (TIGR03085 family)
MTEPIDVRERSGICDLFVELGPDAPTLCEGWTTADLAAHLVLREHFHRWPDAKLAAEKAKGYPVLVARLRAGAPAFPWRIPRLRNVLLGLEYFIHHEDVRRANGRQPRPEMADLEAVSWRMTGYSAKRIAKRISPYGLELARPDGAKKRFGSGQMATLTGPASELILYMGGRRATAHVTLSGDPDAVATLERTTLRV